MTAAQYIASLPLWWAKVGAAVIFFSILVMVWLLPEKFIYRGSPDRKRWRDLRIWATVLVLAQLILYAIF
ncbi:MAG TPA: hypothetical protein ENN21_05585 [Spirochaetes bacterium]|nr:hypothetical protein [Spirochaetota bacterium]